MPQDDEQLLSCYFFESKIHSVTRQTVHCEVIIGVSRKSNGRQFVSEIERFINEVVKTELQANGKGNESKAGETWKDRQLDRQTY